jgi:short-subunit dehydrogenase
MTRSLDGAVVAVVGASGGLGTPIVVELKRRNCTVLLVGPHTDRLAATASTIGFTDPQTFGVVEADLRDTRCGDAIATAATDSFGRLDGVINAAGLVGFGSLLDMDDVTIEELFLVNVLGPLWMIKRVAPLLSQAKGFIANISAVVAESPMANMAAYSATKGALTAADAALSRELRRIGITVCDIRPPHTETALSHHPISGVAPKLPQGLAPEHVAEVTINAILSGLVEVPSTAFAH